MEPAFLYDFAEKTPRALQDDSWQGEKLSTQDTHHYHIIIVFFTSQWSLSHDDHHQFPDHPTYGAWDFLLSRSQEQK